MNLYNIKNLFDDFDINKYTNVNEKFEKKELHKNYAIFSCQLFEF